MVWIKTETEEQARRSSIRFWNKLSSDLTDETFWADKIKEFRGEPAKRLAMAMDNLPLPAAFREAAIALRAMIRSKRKNGGEFSDELALLYWLAAIDSFSIPYSIELQQPGYNVIESIPGKVIRTLPFSYFELGYEQLELLNKTDTKWCVEVWGLPQEHTTLHEIHLDVWKKYERDLGLDQKADRAKLHSQRPQNPQIQGTESHRLT